MAKQHKTIPFDPAAHIQRSLINPEFKAAYDALEDEFSALDALLHARKQAGLTQAEVADRMGIAQSALARIESSLGSRKHSPSLATLRRYAEACGKKLTIAIG
jgi:DNA-binding XRE family transcriptional regulator